MYCKFLRRSLLLLLCGICSSLCAQQRICDLEAICVSPADTVINGNQLLLRFGGINRGPDLLYSNDPIYYMLYEVIDGKTELVYAGFMVGRDSSVIDTGKGVMYVDNYGIGFNFPDRTEPFALDFCVQLDSWKVDAWGDTIRFGYHDPEAGNNSCCKQVVVLPQPLAGISTTEADRDGVLLYPNPAKGVFHIRLKGWWDREALQVTILDIAGKRLLNRNYAQRDATSRISVDVHDLPEGIYIIRIQSATHSVTEKIAIGN